MLRNFKVFDTFAGIGGFTYGLEMAGGFDTAAFCEIDPAAQYWLRKLYPGRKIYSNIVAVSGKELTEVHGKLDLITGGFPCQDVSVAGKGKGIEEGERSGLVFKLVEVIDGARPDWLLLENSPQLRSRGYDRLRSELEGIGYTIWPFVVGARNAGAPHRRERVWIIGTNRLANASSNGRLLGQEFLVQQKCEREAMGWLQLGQSLGLCGGGWSLADSHGAWEQQLQGLHGEVGRRSDNGSEEGRGSVANSCSEGSQESLRRGEEVGTGSHCESAGSSDVGGDGNVADTKGFRLQRLRSIWQQVTEVYARQAVSLRDGGRGRVQGWPARPGEAQHPWEDTRLVPHAFSQSALGLSVDGLSGFVVGRGFATRNEVVEKYAQTLQTSPDAILRTLQGIVNAETFPEWVGRSSGIRQTALLRSFMLGILEDYSSNRKEFEVTTNSSGSQTPEDGVRGVWGDTNSSRTSHRSGSEQQRPIEHPDALQVLSQLLARDCEEAWDSYCRQNALAIPAVFGASGKRVKNPHKKVIEAQLKAMGNSIVPQIACALGMSIRVMDALITEQLSSADVA